MVSMDATFETEKSLFAQGHSIVVGVDEVGRGAIAGPLVFGAVAIQADTSLMTGLRDSKLLSAKRRQKLAEILPTWASGTGLGVVHAHEIDLLGMAAALRVGARRAAANACADSAAIIVDGPIDFFASYTVPENTPVVQSSVVLAKKKADLECASVAAASIIAKVWRDEYMAALAKELPGYGFEKHKGYGSAFHRAAIKTLGASAQHRHSFRLTKD